MVQNLNVQIVSLVFVLKFKVDPYVELFTLLKINLHGAEFECSNRSTIFVLKFTVDPYLELFTLLNINSNEYSEYLEMDGPEKTEIVVLKGNQTSA